ncbi:MAG: hypothetical protein QXY79_01245, partial [Candidatus Methanomethylicia archaeon]
MNKEKNYHVYEFVFNILSRKIVTIIINIIIFVVFLTGLYLNITGAGKDASFFIHFLSHPVTIFALLLLTMNFLFITLSRLDRNVQLVSKPMLFSHKRKYIAILFSLNVCYFAITVYEILFKGHTFYTPMVLFFLLIIIIYCVRCLYIKEHLLASYLLILLVLLIEAHYISFVPSFGNDTWRDVIWAKETIYNGNFLLPGISYPAYTFPLVVLLYSIHSLIGGFDTI